MLGCGSSGPELAPVTGVVTSEGKPLAGVMVEFFPEEGVTSTGLTDSEGRYSLKYNDEEGAVVGNHKVQLTPGMGGVAIMDPNSEEMAPPMQEAPKTVSLKDKVTVITGKNTIDLKIPIE